MISKAGIPMIEHSEIQTGSVSNPAEIGELVRAKRKKDKLTQAQTSALCNVGTRFLSELENGKTTLELGKVLQVLACLGLEVSINQRRWPHKRQS